MKAPRVWYCDHHEVPLPEGHRFPMEKYRRLRLALLERGVLAESQLRASKAGSRSEVRRVHDAEYVDAFLEGSLPGKAMRQIGFPWSEPFAQRCLASVEGTVRASEAALEDGVAGHLAGGTHHAHAGRGSGYCVFNDIAVAATARLDAGDVRRVLVFDVDVHQGDGTAALFFGDDRVFTASIHGARNFPLHKPPSDLDVGLEDGTGDVEYLDRLDHALHHAIQRSCPDLVFVQGGVDALATDALGRMGLTPAGMRERDVMILGELHRRGLPFVLTLGGGYSRPIDATVDAHVATYQVLKDVMDHGRVRAEGAAD